MTTQTSPGFQLKIPQIQLGEDIETASLSTVEKEASSFPNFDRFNYEEKEVIKRLIHTTSCFKEVIDNIFFTDKSIQHIKNLLACSATIIVDTNMIKVGISDYYSKKYNNQTLCFVSDDRVKKMAKEERTTRTYSAVKLALEETFNQPVILACGNAPTFLYSAIESLIKNNWDLNNIAILAFPVGFVNVVESKEYVKEFLNHFNVQGVVMEGRFGSSTMIVALLHAIYKLIEKETV